MHEGKEATYQGAKWSMRRHRLVSDDALETQKYIKGDTFGLGDQERNQWINCSLLSYLQKKRKKEGRKEGRNCSEDHLMRLSYTRN